MKLFIEYRDMPDVPNEKPIEVSSIEEGIAKAKEEYLGYLKVNGYIEALNPKAVNEMPKFEWDGKGLYEIGGRYYSLLLEVGTRVRHRDAEPELVGTIVRIITLGEQDNLAKDEDGANIPVYQILWDGRKPRENCDWSGQECYGQVEEIETKQYDLLIGWEDIAGSGLPCPIIQDVSVLKNVPESDQKLEFGWKGYDCLFCVRRVKGNRERVKVAISESYDEFVREYGAGATDCEEIENIKGEKEQLVSNKPKALTGYGYDGDVNWIEKWLDKCEGERVMYSKEFAEGVYVCLWKDSLWKDMRRV